MQLGAMEDRALAAGHFAREGWALLGDFLEGATAAALRSHLLAREDWNQHLNQGEKLFELSRAVRAGMTEDKRLALDKAVHANARYGFQYRFEGIRVPEAPAELDQSLLHDFARLLNAPATLSLLRGISGAADIAFADAQATLYSPGDFLTTHDDNVAGKNRRAAYVFSLNPEWRLDWGGLLQLHRPEGTAISIAPAMNRLAIFRVPQPHSVSLVTPAAARPRLSITGWLRAG